MLKQKSKNITILLADDDPEDRMLTIDALKESRLVNDLHTVVDGEELMDYLKIKGKYKDKVDSPKPGLILLDLNMPKKDGREALKEIKSDPELKHIPVVVLTTSDADIDIFSTYDIGVNSFITKPVKFDALVKIMKDLGNYWFEIVELPSERTETLNG